MRDAWAIIPARGGSKGLPRKNLRPLAGKPLVAHSVEAAASTSRVSRVIVSTDDEEIAAAARAAGAEVPFLRPAHLASDRAELREALDYTVDRLVEEHAPPVHILVLYPTHPFRSRRSLDRALDLLDRFAQVSSAVPMDVSLARCHVQWEGRTLPLGDEADNELRLHLPTGSFVASLYAPPGRRSHQDPAAWRRYVAERGPRGRSASAALLVADDPGSYIDINTAEDLDRADRHVRGECAAEAPPIGSLPHCVVGLRRVVSSLRSRGSGVTLPIEPPQGIRHVVVWRASDVEGDPFGPLRFHEIVRHGGRLRQRPLFRSPSGVRAELGAAGLQLRFELPGEATGAWIGLGRDPDEDFCDLVKPFSLPPVWTYDPDRGTRHNLLSGRPIRGRQDFPPIFASARSPEERVA